MLVFENLKLLPGGRNGEGRGRCEQEERGRRLRDQRTEAREDLGGGIASHGGRAAGGTWA